MSSIAIDQLPEPQQISSTPIREAAEAFHAAKVAALTAKQDEQELVNTRPSAEWADAQLLDDAAAAGKPAPTLHHVTDHDRKLDEAKIVHKAKDLAEQRTRADLRKALDEHESSWQEEVAARVEKADAAWSETVGRLAAVHRARRADVAQLKELKGEHLGVHAVRLVPVERLEQGEGIHDVGRLLDALAVVGLESAKPERKDPLAQPIGSGAAVGATQSKPTAGTGTARSDERERQQADEIAEQQVAERAARRTRRDLVVD